MSGNFPYFWGIAFLPGSASTYTFNDGSGANIGINESGNHSISTYVDAATTPVGMTFLGTNANFTISEAATSPAFININGAHSFAGIAAHTGASAFYVDGTHSVAGYVDAATSEPIAFNPKGTYGVASFYDQAAAPYAIRLAGTYSAGQIVGTGFSVDSGGTGTFNALKSAGLPTTAGTVKGTLCVDTTGVVYVKTTTGACL